MSTEKNHPAHEFVGRFLPRFGPQDRSDVRVAFVLIFVVRVEAKDLREVFHVHAAAIRTAIEALDGQRQLSYRSRFLGKSFDLVDLDEFVLWNFDAYPACQLEHGVFVFRYTPRSALKEVSRSTNRPCRPRESSIRRLPPSPRRISVARRRVKIAALLWCVHGVFRFCFLALVRLMLCVRWLDNHGAGKIRAQHSEQEEFSFRVHLGLFG